MGEESGPHETLIIQKSGTQGHGVSGTSRRKDQGNADAHPTGSQLPTAGAKV